MEELARFMFECGNEYEYGCDVPALYIANQAVLSLLRKGISTGFSFESGEGITQLVPFYEGFALKYVAKKFSLSGRDLREFILLLIGEINYRFSSLSKINIVKLVKEKVCYVAENYEKEKYRVEINNYELFDGNSINIKEERINCLEAFFKSSNNG